MAADRTGPGAMGRRRRIYLMRHGDVSYFGGDGPVEDVRAVVLTPRGRERASAAGRALAGLTLDRVVTSGLARTVDTAQLVLVELGTPAPEIEEWPDLEELRAGHPDAVAEPDIDDAVLGAFRGIAPPGASYMFGEPVADLVARVVAALDRACINVLDHGPGWYVRAVNLTPDEAIPAGDDRTTTMEEMAEQYRSRRARASRVPNAPTAGRS